MPDTKVPSSRTTCCAKTGWKLQILKRRQVVASAPVEAALQIATEHQAYAQATLQHEIERSPRTQQG
jgi:hypothetical protein